MLEIQETPSGESAGDPGNTLREGLEGAGLLPSCSSWCLLPADAGDSLAKTSATQSHLGISFDENGSDRVITLGGPRTPNGDDMLFRLGNALHAGRIQGPPGERSSWEPA